MNWLSDLNAVVKHHMFEPRDAETLAAIESMFRIMYPGPYILRWSEKDDTIVDIVFEESEETTIWLLKNI